MDSSLEKNILSNISKYDVIPIHINNDNTIEIVAGTNSNELIYKQYNSKPKNNTA